MTKSEFCSIYQQILDRNKSEMLKVLKEKGTPSTPEEYAAFSGEVIILALQTSAQITFDTIVNLGILEDD